MTNYERIAKAIEYLRLHFKEQPSLEEVAKAAYLSPFHFQRLFSEWGIIKCPTIQLLRPKYLLNLGRNKTNGKTCYRK